MAGTSGAYASVMAALESSSSDSDASSDIEATSHHVVSYDVHVFQVELQGS